jgi:hypothetical protein
MTLEEAQSLILRIGTQRFGPAEAATTTAIRAITDIERLKRMVEIVVVAKRWDDLLATS